MNFISTFFKNFLSALMSVGVKKAETQLNRPSTISNPAINQVVDIAAQSASQAIIQTSSSQTPTTPSN